MPKKILAQAKGRSDKGGKPGPAAKLRAVRAAIKPKATAPIKKAAKKAPAKRSAPKKKATAAKKATSAASAASKKKKKKNNAAASPKAAQSKSKRKAAPAAAKTAPKKKEAAAPPSKKQSKAKKQAAPKAKAQKAPATKQAAPKAKAQKAPAAKQAASAPAASKPASRSSRAAPPPAPVASGPASRKRGRDVQSSEAGAGVAKAASAEAAPRPIKAARPSSVHELKVAPLADNKKNVSPQVRKVGKPVANAKNSMSPSSKRAEEERATAAEKKAAAALKARVDAVAAAEKKKQTEEGSKAAAAANAPAEKTHSWPARGCAFITTKEKNPLAPHWSCTGSKAKHHSFNISLGIHPWTKDEEDALMEGMELHGRSWSRILRDPRFEKRFHKSRNQVKLKDKERCMRLSKSNEDGDRSLNKSEAASRRHGMQDGKRKKKEAWTEAETKLFRLAVEKEGVGSWKQIWEAQPLLQKRTVVDLKDKWRNMNKAKAHSFLKVSSKTNMPIDV